jgi:hypothetical protein
MMSPKDTKILFIDPAEDFDDEFKSMVENGSSRLGYGCPRSGEVQWFVSQPSEIILQAM